MSMDRDQEKAMFAKMGSRNTRDTNPNFSKSRTSRSSRLTPKMQMFISAQIKKEIRSGRGQQQSVAIAFSKARMKFGNSRLIPKVQNRQNALLDKKTERLLFTLLGAAIAIEVIRIIRRQ